MFMAHLGRPDHLIPAGRTAPGIPLGITDMRERVDPAQFETGPGRGLSFVQTVMQLVMDI
jgi:hypothetical protein